MRAILRNLTFFCCADWTLPAQSVTMKIVISPEAFSC